MSESPNFRARFRIGVRCVSPQRNRGSQTNAWEWGPVVADASAKKYGWSATSYKLDTVPQGFHFALAEIASHLAVKRPEGGKFIVTVREDV